MFDQASYQCSYCGETVEASVDPGQAPGSSYVEDCEVCCRPNLLTVRRDPVDGTRTLAARPETDAG